MDAASAVTLVALVVGRYPDWGGYAPGMQLASHEVHETHVGHTRHVEIDDVVENDSDDELEAQYRLKLPRNAAISRVGLSIQGVLVDGEVIDRQRAETIYSEIVDGPVPKDPAVVEREADGTIRVRIFPVAPHGTRHIRLTYDAPNEDLPARASLAVGREGFLLRIPARATGVTAADPHAIVIDVSHSRTTGDLSDEVAAARRILDDLPAGRAFSLHACDASCETFPDTGAIAKTTESMARAGAFLDGMHHGGARDVAGAIRSASARLDGRGLVTFIGGGRSSAGELSPSSVSAAARRALGHTAELEVIPIDDDGSLESLVTDVRYPVSWPSALVPVMRRRDDAMLTIIGRVQGGFDGGLAFDGAPLAAESSTGEVRSIDRIAIQAQVDVLDATPQFEGQDRAAKLARSHHLLSNTSSFIVLESEEMFARNGIARTEGATRARPVVGAPAKRASGDRPRSHRVRAPVMRAASMCVVTGRIPPENIQFIMRQNAARLRYCYQEGLSDDPSLDGRVIVRFVFDGDGVVRSAQDGGSDLPDPQVIACVVNVVKEMTFTPSPYRDLVTVTYPLMFRREEGASPERPLLHLRVPASSTPSPHEVWALEHRADARGNDSALYVAAAEALAIAGETAREAKAWDALADLSPDSADVHLRAASAYARSFDAKRAIAHYASAKELALRTPRPAPGP